MIKTLFERLLWVLGFAMFASPAYAFPIVEGASMIGSVVGVISSLIASMIPSLSKQTRLISLLVFITLCTISFGGYSYRAGETQENVDLFAYQSRPVMPSNSEMVKSSKANAISTEQSHVDYFNTYTKSLITFTRFQESGKYEELTPVFLDYVAGGSNSKPEYFSENKFNIEDKSGYLEFSKKIMVI